MRFHSTPQSQSQGDISALAIIETISAIAISISIAVIFDTLIHIAIGSILAPILLLRSTESINYGIALFLKMAPDPRNEQYNTPKNYFIILFTSILSRLISTALHLKHGLLSFPDNWRKLILCTDFKTPLEPVPGAGPLASYLEPRKYQYKSVNSIVSDYIGIYDYIKKSKNQNPLKQETDKAFIEKNTKLVPALDMSLSLYVFSKIGEIEKNHIRLKEFSTDQVGLTEVQTKAVEHFTNPIYQHLSNTFKKENHISADSISRIITLSLVTEGRSKKHILDFIQNISGLLISVLAIFSIIHLTPSEFLFPTVFTVGLLAIAPCSYFFILSVPTALIYGINYFYRFSLKTTSIIWLPLIFSIRTSLDTRKSLHARINDPISKRFSKLVRVISSITILLFSIKVFALPHYIDWWNSLRISTTFNYIVMPNEINLWHITTFTNAIIAITSHYFLLSVSDIYIKKGTWSERNINIIYVWISYIRGALSTYSITVGIYLTTITALQMEWPTVNFTVFPW